MLFHPGQHGVEDIVDKINVINCGCGCISVRTAEPVSVMYEQYTTTNTIFDTGRGF
jgi:hypothetical protein